MLSDANIPRDLRQLRACMVCSLIKSAAMFEEQGCDNCEQLLEMRNDREKVDMCTRFVRLHIIIIESLVPISME